MAESNTRDADLRRVHVIQELKILDSSSGSVFDDLATLAVTALECPMAVVGFMDDRTYWCKSRVGFETPELPRESSLCERTIIEARTILLQDTNSDPSAALCPLVSKTPFVRFYLGVPIEADCGTVIGTIAVLDTRPREPRQAQVEVMQRLARQATSILKLRAEALRRERDLEEQLRSKALIRSLYETSPFMMSVVKLVNGVVVTLSLNTQMLSFVGLPREEVVGRPVGPGFPHDGLVPLFVSKYERSLLTGSSERFSFMLDSEAGRRGFDVVVNHIGPDPADGSPMFSCVVQEISDRLELEERLERERDRFRRAIEGANAGIWDSDLVTGETYHNDRWRAMLGYGSEDLPDGPDVWFPLIHPEDRDCVFERMREYEQGLSEFYEVEHRLRCKDGSYRWTLSRGKGQRDESGRLVRMTGWQIDIHEQREAFEALRREKAVGRLREAELRTQHDRFETVVNNIPVMLGLFNERGEFIWVNDAWVHTLGWNLEECRSRDILSDFYPDPSARQRALNFMMSPNSGWMDFDTTIRDGRVIPTRWCNIRLASGGTIGIGQDISDQRQRERLISEQQVQIIASAKTASLGEMAGSIAHEINNPLAIIHAKAEQLMSLIAAGEEPAKISSGLERILKTSDRIARIVRGLRQFSRNGDADPFISISLDQIVEDTLELCRERFRHHGIELRVKTAKDVLIECRGVQVSQVILNLLSNAFDAVCGKPGSWVSIESEAVGGFAFIHVTDSGTGIPPEIASQMMTPFFTTKEVGSGTGLGLSISQGIAKSHGGHLRYDSTRANTCFALVLPLKQNNTAPA